jgi:hypothetical protein
MKLLNEGNIQIKTLPPQLYSLQSLGKTAIIASAGIILFFIATTKTGKKILHLIRNRPRDFHGLFAALAIGMATLALWLMRFS